MTILAEPDVKVMSQRLPGGFILALSQGAVKHLHVLGCPTPSPFVSMLVRMKNIVMVWDDAFSLGHICNFFPRKHPCTFANSCLYAWLWRSSLVPVCLASLLPLEHSSMMWLPLLGTLQNTVFYSLFIESFSYTMSMLQVSIAFLFLFLFLPFFPPFKQLKETAKAATCFNWVATMLWCCAILSLSSLPTPEATCPYTDTSRIGLETPGIDWHWSSDGKWLTTTFHLTKLLYPKGYQGHYLSPHATVSGRRHSWLVNFGAFERGFLFLALWMILRQHQAKKTSAIRHNFTWSFLGYLTDLKIFFFVYNKAKVDKTWYWIFF